MPLKPQNTHEKGFLLTKRHFYMLRGKKVCFKKREAIRCKSLTIWEFVEDPTRKALFSFLRNTIFLHSCP
jgi:hypothetical protein